MGNILVRKGRYSEARTYYLRALERDPDHAGALAPLAHMLSTVE